MKKNGQPTPAVFIFGKEDTNEKELAK